MRIHLLDPLIANQIAAGEVIERPASIVKELLENSLDAGATELIIDIEKGGVQLIRIKDNGRGIHKEDLALAVQRHGTSKIQKIQDLTAIQSFGFRGEALASICSVSKLKISSFFAGQSQAWQLQAIGTETELAEKPVAHLQGTTIEVRDLFFNTPVRRKFLRTEKTEFLHIEEIIKRIALTNFNLRIEFTHNDRAVFKLLPATTDLLQEKRIKQICAKGFIDHALKIDVEATGLRIWGWIATDTFTRPQNDMQYLYINGRMVRDKLVNHAIRLAYQQLDTSKYTAYILFLECDPAIVDVNVHPTKHEVRFRESRLIHDFIYSSLKKVLAKQELFIPSTALEPTQQTELYIKNYSSEPKVTQHKIAEQMANYTILADNNFDKKVKIETVPEIIEIADDKKLGKILQCIQGKYLVLEHEQGLMLLDIMQLQMKFLSYALANVDSISIQPLLFPLNITLNKQQMLSFEAHNAIFMKFGFDISAIEVNKIILRTAPKAFQDVNFIEFIPAVLDALSLTNAAKLPQNLIASIAPKFINSILDLKQLEEQLLKKAALLSEAEFNSACVVLSLKQIKQLFSV